MITRCLLALVALGVHARAQGCAAGNPGVVAGPLTTLEHKVSGVVSLTDGCTLQASGFTYDGKAPAVYWWGAPSCSARDIARGGARLSDQQITDAYSGQTLTVPLRTGINWTNISCISVYCEEAKADLGHVAVTVAVAPPAPPQPLAAPAPESAAASMLTPAAMTAASIYALPNCIELIPGVYNLHWRVDGSDVTLGMEARTGAGNRWLGFGFSPANATDTQMVGSDVVLGGIVGGKCFVLNYHLSDRSQCDFATGQGACPDYAGTGVLGGPTNASMLACDRAGDTLAVLLRRPLGNSDGRNNSWPLDGSRFTIWAMGPVSEGSTANRPVVLYHELQLPGTNAAKSVHTVPGQGFKVNLGKAPATACTRLMVPTGLAAPAPEGEGVKRPRVQPAVIEGVKSFDVTLGPNPNYPNPPGWGVSYQVNGKESAVLVVERGTEYTFTVEAGPTHPLYITTSIIGGGSLDDYAGQTVFAGNETTFGEPGKPTVFKWTPNANTPSLVYYQCAVHQKIGWEIRVVDPAAAGPVAAAAPPVAMSVPAPKSLGTSPPMLPALLTSVALVITLFA